MSKLQIKNLQIFSDDKKLVDISLSLENTTALIGQSGSGKSLSLKAILNLLPKNLKASFDIDSTFELSKDNIGFIPQNPFTSLSPLTKIGKQFFCQEQKKRSYCKM